MGDTMAGKVGVMVPVQNGERRTVTALAPFDLAPYLPANADYAAYEQFVALCEQEAGGSGSALKRTRAYIPRKREEAKQQLINDYFGDDETLPKYPEENFRRRQRYDACGRLSISPILKCTSVIHQLAYDTKPDPFDEYLKIAEHCSRQCLENFTKCIHVLYVEKFLRKPTAADI
ncbi:hypothetical protein Tco_1455740 [Tanacetum coccineum]